MLIEIDFSSDEAIYQQLCNQIILGIASSQVRGGEQLPSVRQLAETIGINMHTVNKAYAILQREGFLKIDRRRGAVVAVDISLLEEEADGLQMSLFDDVADTSRERRQQEAILEIRRKFGKNAILKGMNFEEGATTRDRNQQIGGHHE